jgi:hypothetical protein
MKMDLCLLINYRHIINWGGGDDDHQVDHVLVQVPGERTLFFEPFIYINDHFIKTGSGQT